MLNKYEELFLNSRAVSVCLIFAYVIFLAACIYFKFN